MQDLNLSLHQSNTKSCPNILFQEKADSFMRTLNSPFFATRRKRLNWLKKKSSNLNEEGEVSETGNALQPSAHLSISQSRCQLLRGNIITSTWNQVGRTELPQKHKKQILWEMSRSEIASLQLKPGVIYCKQRWSRGHNRHLSETLDLKQAVKCSVHFHRSERWVWEDGEGSNHRSPRLTAPIVTIYLF